MALPALTGALATDSPKAVLVQLQMAETLRRLEARVGALQQQVQPFLQSNFRESIASVHEIAGRLTKAAAELDGMIEYTHMMVKELADIQAKARQGGDAVDGESPKPKRARMLRRRPADEMP